ncbi:hypothetical protein [Streptomyces nigrescens]
MTRVAGLGAQRRTRPPLHAGTTGTGPDVPSAAKALGRLAVYDGAVRAPSTGRTGRVLGAARRIPVRSLESDRLDHT